MRNVSLALLWRRGVNAVIGCCALLIAGVAAAQGVEPEPGPIGDEIVVTGERSNRTLRDTASSVAVVTSSQIESQPVDRVDQLLDLIPNIQSGSGGEGPTIRGQDTTGPARDLYAFLGGTRPRTTLIVDGRPVGFNEFVFGVAPVWDVDRIEVFRSPQSTTQGKNSIAGAIFVETRDPGMTSEYRARAIAGTALTRQLSALASGPIVDDQLAARLSGDFRYSRPASRIEDKVPGADADHDVYGQVRLKLLATPKAVPEAHIELTYSHIRSQMPGTELIRGDFRKREDLSGFAAIFRTNVDTLTASVRYALGPSATARFLVTGGDSHIRRFALAGFGQTDIRVRDLFAEAVVDWAPSADASFVGGLSHGSQRLRQHIDLSRFAGIGEFADRQTGSGLFGEARLAVLPRTVLTAGLRYQEDRQVRTGSLGSPPAPAQLDFTGTFDALLPKVSLSYDLSPDVRIGVLVQRAYNPGGTTLSYDTGRDDPYDAETLWDYELFGRASFAGGAVQAAVNAFYYDMTDAQRARPILINGVGFADMFNVEKARSYGLEAQFDWRSGRRFSASAGIGLLRTEIVRSEGIYRSYEGKDFQRSPRFSASASVDWRPVDRARLTAGVRHNSGYWSDDENNPVRRIESRTTIDGRGEWDAGRLRLFAYARNLLNSFYLTYKFTPLVATAGDPRELGIGVETRF